MDCDTIFLGILTGISFLILAVDFKVLEKMFQEYFKVNQILDAKLYNECYKPQAEMRIVFECFAIFSAFICTLLTLALTFGLSDDNIEWVARKVVNMFFLLYGPILTTLCVFGFSEIKQLSRICTMHGISPHSNFVNLFVLIVSAIFSISVTVTMAMEKTVDMATVTFSNENSIVFRLSAMYFQYQARLRDARSRDRNRHRRFERDERRADQETAQALEQLMQRQREIEEQQALLPKGEDKNHQEQDNDQCSTSGIIQEDKNHIQTLGNSQNSPRPSANSVIQNRQNMYQNMNQNQPSINLNQESSSLLMDSRQTCNPSERPRISNLMDLENRQSAMPQSTTSQHFGLADNQMVRNTHSGFGSENHGGLLVNQQRVTASTKGLIKDDISNGERSTVQGQGYRPHINHENQQHQQQIANRISMRSDNYQTSSLRQTELPREETPRPTNPSVLK